MKNIRLSLYLHYTMIGLTLSFHAALWLLSFCEARPEGKFLGVFYEKFKESSKPSYFTPESYPELKSNLYQGDILLPVTRNAIISNYYKWPWGVIPYTIQPYFTIEERSKIRKAMDAIESKTCLKFVDKNDGKAMQAMNLAHNDYLSITRELKKGCYAMIGYQQNFGKPHTMNLESPICLNTQGTIQHELLHVAGLLHEQSRYDRDNAVVIYWENIDKTYWSDFNKVADNYTTTYGLPYDYTSVMHYPRYAFSKNGKETIVARNDPNMALGQRNGATATDLQKVYAMYSCTGVSSMSNSGDYLGNTFRIF
ncbi:low choriolytic enzyme-like [Adelges cooleyi]|uniref:low choriolytic enzyme-like n=1 Tax=Adelges cooleyi TaxID=133065 RepID=UPI00217FEA73|nr:low choriolytic enzyme-like [Adelges cooleyi]